MTDKLDQIRALVKDVAEGGGYELVDVELSGSGDHRTLKIFIDQQSGISHGDCEQVSRQVGTILDVEDVLPYAYTLEVSSPGLDRKLTRTEDFTRFEGRLIKVQTKLALDNQKVFRGRLGGIDNGKIQLTMKPDRPVEIPLDAVREARLEIDLDSELHAPSTAGSQ